VLQCLSFTNTCVSSFTIESKSAKKCKRMQPVCVSFADIYVSFADTYASFAHICNSSFANESKKYQRMQRVYVSFTDTHVTFANIQVSFSGIHVSDTNLHVSVGKNSHKFESFRRIRQVQNTTGRYNSGTMNLNSNRISTVRGHAP